MSVDDVPGSNTFGDENFFADGVVTSVGQIIGIVVAKTKEIAQRGGRSVKIDYEKLPTILTIEVNKKGKIRIYIRYYYFNYSGSKKG